MLRIVKKAGSAGKACYNHEILVVRANADGPSNPVDILPPGEVGEILVKGPCMMVGYYNREKETNEAINQDWYHKSDLGYIDKDGYLYIADRIDRNRNRKPLILIMG